MPEPGPPPFVIRPLDPGDPGERDALARLLAMHAEAVAGRVDPPIDEIIRRLAERPAVVALLAWSGGYAVGAAVGVESYGIMPGTPLLNLQELVVSPASRGRGIGRALVRAFEQQARRRGCGWVTLEVLGDNASALSLYRRCGYAGGDAISPAGAPMFFVKRLGGTDP